MSTQQLLVIAAIVILANAILLLAVVVQARLGQGSRRPTADGVSAALARRLGEPVDDDPASDGRADEDAPAMTAGPKLVLLGLEAPRPTRGLGWDSEVRREHGRTTRYRRPATIVLVEVLGLERLARQLGQDVADRVVVAVGSTLRSEARVADHIEALSPLRFGALLPETDEIQAINFVERVRQDCDRWLESGIGSLRVAIGWAQMGPTQTPDRAIALAEERLHAERRTYLAVAAARAEPDDRGDLTDRHDELDDRAGQTEDPLEGSLAV